MTGLIWFLLGLGWGIPLGVLYCAWSLKERDEELPKDRGAPFDP